MVNESITYGDFVLPRTAPAHFAYLLLVIDPAVIGDVPRMGHLHVRLAFPEYMLPAEFDLLPDEQRIIIVRRLERIRLVPIDTVVHHEDAGLVLVYEGEQQRYPAAEPHDMNAHQSVLPDTNLDSHALTDSYVTLFGDQHPELIPESGQDGANTSDME